MNEKDWHARPIVPAIGSLPDHGQMPGHLNESPIKIASLLIEVLRFAETIQSSRRAIHAIGGAKQGRAQIQTQTIIR